MADHAIISRDTSRAQVAPRTMLGQPVSPMGAWCGLIMAANAVILAMALQTSLTVSARLETVA